MKKIQSNVKIVRKIVLASFLFCLLFATATLFPISSSEQRAKAASEAENPSLTLDIQSNTATANLEPSIDGSFVKSSNITFSVSSDNFSGYKILVLASDNDGYLSSENYNISSITSSLTEAQFNTAQYNNKWGLQYNNTYLSSPTTTATTLGSTTVANSSADQYALSFAARINHEVPMGTYTKDLTLSVVANPIPEDKIMQNYTYERCQAEAANGNATLADIRDGKSYTVRYINGNCWMTQNLAYDLKTNNTLLPDTSDVSSKMTINAVGDLTSGDSYTEARVHAPTAEDLTLSEGVSKDLGRPVITAEQTGYWYNYCAATAGEICSDPNDDYENPLNMQEAIQSVCPTGWRLPTHEEQNRLIGLENQYLPVRGGIWNGGVLEGAHNGNWWSSTAGSPEDRLFVYFDASDHLNSASYRRDVGYYVRCVRKQSMQSYTNEKCASEAADKAVTLIDDRDNKEYTARYMNGSCWMTQNLSFDLTTGMTLSSDTTNLRGLVPEGSTETVTKTLGTVGVLPDKTFNTYTEARVQVPTGEDLTKTKLTTEENGYWYNYCAASAGQICVNSSTDEATIDICPANWKMPSDTEWNNIGGDGSWSKTNVDAFSPVKAGNWYTSTLGSPSTHGYWWSTTAYDANRRYYLFYYPSDGLYLGNYGSLILGFSVRCMLTK